MKSKTTLTAVLLIFLAGLHSNRVFAQLTGWQYITPVTVYENSGAGLTDYNILLAFDTQTPIAAGKMKADGGDIRFAEDVDGALLLSYWIESGINTINTRIWVKVPSILASDSVKIYMFYGNPSATTTGTVSSIFYSGLQALYTFTEGIGDTLYDKLGNYNLPLTGLTWQTGFRNNVASLTGWTGGGRSFISSNGPVLGTGDFTVFAFIDPNTPTGATQGVVGNYFDDGNNGWVVKLQGGAGQFMLLTNEAGNWCQQGAGTLTTAWAQVGAKRNSGISDYMYQNGNNILSLCPADNRNLNNSGPFEIGHSYNNQYAFDGNISFVAVYNIALSDVDITKIYNSIYVSPEPTLSIGAENIISSLEATNDTSICIGNSVNLTVAITDSAGFPAPYTFLWTPADSLSCTACQSPVANPTSTTTYMVMVTDSSGAKDSAFVTVTIYSLPPVADAGLDSTICVGDSVQLSATGGVYYSWSPSTGLSNTNLANPFASPTITTAYQVSVSNGCGSDVDTVTITIISPPVDAGVDTSFCFGGSVILEALGATSFVWSPATGLSCTACTKPTASPLVTTTYYVTGTDINGCINTDSVTVTVNGMAQIIAVSSADTICPGNPAQLNVLIPSGSCDDYDVSNIPFAPLAGSGTFVTLSDDEVSTVLPIGFNFNFYCNDYTNFYISSNGFITFNNNTNSGCCSGQFLPNTTDPNNLIAFAWDDLYPPGNGTIDYFTTGTAPNRKLVVRFTDIPYCCGATPEVSTQVILYETTNFIEIHTTFINNIDPGTMGLENDGGTLAHVVPGRNSANWSAVNEGILFSRILSVPDTTVIYSWSPSTGLSDTAIADPLASPATTTTYVVTADDNGCTYTDTITIYIDTSNFITATPVTAICEGDSVQLGVTGTTGMPDDSTWAYAWAPGSSLTDSTGAAPVAFPASTTTYQITVSNACGIFTDTVMVTVNPAPVVDAGVDTSYCFGTGSSVNLEALGATSFVWSPSAGLSCTACTKPTASPLFTTTYYVTGTTAGCSATDSIKITVNGAPIVAVSSTDTICLGDSVQLSAQSSCTQQIVYSETYTNGISYCPGTPQYDNWGIFRSQLDPLVNTFTSVTIKGSLDIVGRTCTDAAMVTQMAGALFTGVTGSWTCGAFSFAIGIGCAGGCALPADAIEFNATGSNCACDNPGYILRPAIGNSNWGGVNSATCGGATQTMTVIFESGGSCPPDSSLTYAWSPATGLSGTTIANPLASPATTTTYVVTADDNGCTNTDTITVYVDNTIIVLTPEEGLCTGDSVQLITTSNNSIISWSWNPADSLSSTTIADPIANPSSTTTYTVTATDALGCQLTKDVTVSVAPYPVASFTHSESALTVAFTNASVNADTWEWQFGDGFGSTSLLNPTHTYDSAGTYNACLIVTNACSIDTFCELITVTDCQVPSAAYGYGISGPTVSFSDLSQNATGWSWNFGDSSAIDNNQNPTHTYSDTGTYNVCLTATNTCSSDSICNTISITSAVGVAESTSGGENGINIYPNPNSGVFTVEIYDLHPPIGGYDLRVYDVLNREIFNSHVVNRTSYIDLRGHPAGIYNLQVITDQGISNNKIIIE